MTDFAVMVEGLAALQGVETWSDDIRQAITRALNRTADKARSRAEDQIRREVNFPAGYLSPSANRLAVTHRATRTDLAVTVSGRDRATSLARFVSGSPKVNTPGVTVAVRPGRAIFLRRAFIVQLRAGPTATTNRGLAVRLPKGSKPNAAYRPKELSSGLWLLYGPSVDQTFKQLIAKDDSFIPEMTDFLEAEFTRQLEL